MANMHVHIRICKYTSILSSTCRSQPFSNIKILLHNRANIINENLQVISYTLLILINSPV